MSVLNKQIKVGLSSIAEARTHEDAKSAYADFHQLLEAEKPEPHTIIAASRQEDRVLKAIAKARSSTTYQRRGDQVGYGRVFQGSGIVVVGSKEGDLLAVSYQTDPSGNDPVDEAYREDFGPYQRVGLRKAAQALLLHGLGLAEVNFQAQYAHVQGVLMEKLGETNRHYMGYNTGNGLAVGASGMLADNGVIAHARTMPWHDRYVDDALRNGELESPSSLDMLAGWFDHKAAEATVAKMSNSEPGLFLFDNLYPPESVVTYVNLS